jgi:uncharacterized protein YbjT (DUF2867 family)
MEVWLGPRLFADAAAGTAKVYGRGTDGLRYVSVRDVACVAVECVNHPAAFDAIVPIGGPDRVSQRDAVHLFEEAFGKTFSTIEIPEHALEAQWAAAADPFSKTFTALMLGVARGLDADSEPDFESFPRPQVSVRDFARGVADAP